MDLFERDDVVSRGFEVPAHLIVSSIFGATAIPRVRGDKHTALRSRTAFVLNSLGSQIFVEHSVDGGS